MAKIVNISGSEITDTGIQRLVDYCRNTLTGNYTLIIGCLPYNSDIDAILIGNGNIYAVECKHWKGEIEGSTYGYWTKDGETISNPLHQTRNNTVALARWLREKTGLNGSLWVRGLLVFTHDHCHTYITRDNGSNNGVEVVLLGDLKGYLERQEKTVKEEVANKVVGVFEGMKNIVFYDRREGRIMGKHTKRFQYSYKANKVWLFKRAVLLFAMLATIAAGCFILTAQWGYAAWVIGGVLLVGCGIMFIWDEFSYVKDFDWSGAPTCDPVCTVGAWVVRKKRR
jgi:hypothetical protein